MKHNNILYVLIFVFCSCTITRNVDLSKSPSVAEKKEYLFKNLKNVDHLKFVNIKNRELYQKFIVKFHSNTGFIIPNVLLFDVDGHLLLTNERNSCTVQLNKINEYINADSRAINLKNEMDYYDDVIIQNDKKTLFIAWAMMVGNSNSLVFDWYNNNINKISVDYNVIFLNLDVPK
jgi:hypothetical protein